MKRKHLFAVLALVGCFFESSRPDWLSGKTRQRRRVDEKPVARQGLAEFHAPIQTRLEDCRFKAGFTAALKNMDFVFPK